MNEQLKSTIRQILLVAAGVGPVATFLAYIGLNPADFPQIVDILLLIGGAGASLWAILTRSKKAIVAQAADIVPVPVASQKEVGITTPQTVPSQPPA